MLDQIKDTTGMEGEDVLRIVFVVCLFFTLIGTFKAIITNIIGVAYPALKSLEALEGNDQLEQKKWLTYWVCFAVLLIFDRIAEKMFIKRLIPFYFFLKLALLIYLFHPKI